MSSNDNSSKKEFINYCFVPLFSIHLIDNNSGTDNMI